MITTTSIAQTSWRGRVAVRRTVTTGVIALAQSIYAFTALGANVSAVSGKVSDEDGAPCAGFKIVVAPSKGVIRTAMSGPDGLYTIPDLEPGSAAITVSVGGGYSIGHAGVNARGRQVVLRPGEIAFVDFVLPARRKRVAGRVMGTDGRPIAGAHVAATVKGSQFARALVCGAHMNVDAVGVSDADGRYLLERVPAGPLVIGAHDDARRLVGVLEAKEGSASADVRLKRSTVLNGTIVDSEGRAVPKTKVGAVLRSIALADSDSYGCYCYSELSGWFRAGDERSFKVVPEVGLFELRLTAGKYELTLDAGNLGTATVTFELKDGEARRDARIVLLGKSQ